MTNIIEMKNSDVTCNSINNYLLLFAQQALEIRGAPAPSATSGAGALISNAQLRPKNEFVKLKTFREWVFDENLNIFEKFWNS